VYQENVLEVQEVVLQNDHHQDTVHPRHLTVVAVLLAHQGMKMIYPKSSPMYQRDLTRLLLKHPGSTVHFLELR
jgi:hypothetical protein